VFNWSEVHLSEMTCYKIHTLVGRFQILIEEKMHVVGNLQGDIK